MGGGGGRDGGGANVKAIWKLYMSLKRALIARHFN